LLDVCTQIRGVAAQAADLKKELKLCMNLSLILATGKSSCDRFFNCIAEHLLFDILCIDCCTLVVAYTFIF